MPKKVNKSEAHNNQMVALALLEMQFGRRDLSKEIRKKYSPQRMAYWRRKIQDNTFHPQNHGGFRKERLKYSREVKEHIEDILWLSANQDRTKKITEYVRELKELGLETMTPSYVGRIFRSWGMSWKKMQYKHPHKYSETNTQYYKTFQEWESLLTSWKNIKFLDESHFVNKGKFRYSLQLLL
jgi:hypothetical protein